MAFEHQTVYLFIFESGKIGPEWLHQKRPAKAVLETGQCGLFLDLGNVAPRFPPIRSCLSRFLWKLQWTFFLRHGVNDTIFFLGSTSDRIIGDIFGSRSN